MSNGSTAAPRAYSSRRAWYAICVLVLLYSLSFIDRFILSLLAPAVSEHLQLSDTQLGVLFGLGFGVVYALTGLPLAHLIDRRRRVPIVAAGVVLWSICTIASGFAPNFTGLLILRAGVAVGEAVLSPAAISIIADIFPREKRALPTAVYSAVATVMASGSFVIGGAALQVATGLADRFGLEPWQITLMIVGAPGLLLAPLLLFTVREPPRGGEVDAAYDTPRQAANYVLGESMLYGCLFLASALIGMASFAKLAWAPTLLVRAHGMEVATAGYMYGSVCLVAGLAGAMIWPTVVQKWTQNGHRNALVTVFTFCLTLCWVSVAVVGVAPSEQVLLAGAGFATFFGAGGSVLVPLLIQLVTPGRMRARIMALYVMATGLVGLAFGPPVAAMLSEHFFDGPRAIGYGVTALACSMGPIASLAVWSMHASYLRALKSAEDLEAGFTASRAVRP